MYPNFTLRKVKYVRSELSSNGSCTAAKV